MAPEIIGDRLTALQTALVEKMGRQPALPPYLVVWSSARSQVMLYLDTHGNVPECPAADSIEAAFEAAEQIVAAMPEPADRDRHQFMKELALLIDKGRAKGIDVAFLNPLEATMKRLSTNALTADRSTFHVQV